MKTNILQLFCSILLVGFFSACDTASTSTTATSTDATTDSPTTEGEGDLAGFTIFEIPNSGGLKKAEKRNPDFVKSQGIEEEGYLKNGKKQGTWTKYEKRWGTPGLITPYDNGVISGNVVRFDDRGALTNLSAYVNGRKEGYQIKYNRTFPISESFYKNGKLEGKKKLYYDDGKIRQETEYVNGKRNGLDTYYSQEETISLQYEYKDGEKVRQLDTPIAPKGE